MQPNLFYLSGPHGSGKTTLETKLAKHNPLILVPELYSKNVKFNTEPLYRQFLKMGSRAIENYEYLQIAKENPDRIILANRCVYDNSAYNRSFLMKGWLTEKEFDFFEELRWNFFRDENSCPYAIVLNPPFEVVEKHLNERWKSNEKKWREEDMGYARLTCEAYKLYEGMPGILYVDHEIDLESKDEISFINTWMQSIYDAHKMAIPSLLEQLVER